MGKGATQSGTKKQPRNGNPPPTPKIRTATPATLKARMKNAIPVKVGTVNALQ